MFDDGMFINEDSGVAVMILVGLVILYFIADYIFHWCGNHECLIKYLINIHN